MNGENDASLRIAGRLLLEQLRTEIVALFVGKVVQADFDLNTSATRCLSDLRR
jgi:hypothetical protein